MTEAPASGDPFLLSGQTIEGKYRVASVVGDGGFGVVYRAVHKGFGELIAVKCLKMPALDEKEREELLELLREEGRLLHRLSRMTPNIVQALDVGAFTTEGGVWVPYLVLEWLEGQTLAHFLRERAERDEYGMSLTEAVRLLDPAARALAVAHTQRVAHRDVKPANLFLTDVGGTRTLKVLDFGIAKVLIDCASVTEALAATRDGPSAFTPRYGAPEQFSKMRGATGPWTDVFALALIFVEIVSGRRALDGDDPTQLYVAAADPTLRPTLRLRGVDAGDAVEQVLRKALAVEPKERYASAGEMWDALTAAVREAPANAGAPQGALLGSAGSASPALDTGPSANSPTPRTGNAPNAGAAGAEGFDATIPVESLDAGGGRSSGSGSGGGGGIVSSGSGRPPAGAPGVATVKHGARPAAHLGLTDSMAETPRGQRAGQNGNVTPPAVQPPSTSGPPATSDAPSAPAPNASPTPPPRAARARVWPWLALLALVGGGAAVYVDLVPASPRSPASPRPSAPRPTASPRASTHAVAPSSASPSASASASAAPSASASAAPFSAPEDMVFFAPQSTVIGAGGDQRNVTLTRGFYLDRHEVTARAYQACVSERLCSPADHVSVTPEGGPETAALPVDKEFVDTWTRRCNASRGEPNHPVNCVDYASAESYCKYRGRRLPTEAEWEIAARGAAQRPFPWGTDAPTCDRACYDRNEGCRIAGTDVATCTSGTHPGDRTPEGIQDLAGNVAEWVQDGFTTPPPGGTDPRADPSMAVKVVRGGSFFDDAAKLSATWRGVAAAVTASANIGFRCALDAPDPAAPPAPSPEPPPP
ncbi:SUMF1/EgtB/PvdO family nonheme iron enzyme [Chondromyces apiculatus]|uniref:Adenylate cyclase n=1 Tax=Chondromyces apiculatus DSM 436 TaxID=1192034 RepID=A0A017TB88_9BACT|nr:SUMF1/EgtB/PvdO family nonheme iron enzyme [Chondromyces apiculatus]EYF06065.1 Adenylate cyclase [Chondromyces apiculatus DSM 436]